MVYELVDELGNRYGRHNNLKTAEMYARMQANTSHRRINVLALALSDTSKDRYGEKVYYTAAPDHWLNKRIG